MKKSEVVWLIVKLAGVYFCWLAFEASLTLLASLGALSGARGMPGATGWVIVPLMLKAGVYAALGFYCVENGSLFFSILNRESAD
jgi:hypothetical protein